MIHSIFTFGKSVVRRIMPFGPIDVGEDEFEDQLMAPDLISVGEFLDSFRKLSTGTPSLVNTDEMETTVRNASEEWFKLLLMHEGLQKLLSASSPEAEKFLCDLFLKNKKFLDAILANSSQSARQFAAGVKESATIRRNVYLLLISLGMHSYEGYVLIYKTVNLVQRERPNGMFQYITEEIAGATQQDSRSPEARLEALLPPLALMVVLFAGGNGFFIESHLRQQIHGSKLLTSLVETAQTKFVEEKHNRRLELPTLKEPSPREVTPQINQAIEMLEQAEKSSDKILLWLEKFGDGKESSSPTPPSTELPSSIQKGEGVREYVVNLESTPKYRLPDSVTSPESGYESAVEIATLRSESRTDLQTSEINQEGRSEGSEGRSQEASEGRSPPVAPPRRHSPSLQSSLQSPPSVISFQEFASGAGVVPPEALVTPPVTPPVPPSPVAPPVPSVMAPSAPSVVAPPVTSVVAPPVPPPVPVVREVAPQEKQRPVAEVRPMPGGTIPIPPPPPPPPVMNPNGSVVDSRVNRSNLKPLRWTKLDTTPDVVMQSVWEPKKGVPQIDMDKLEEMFKIEKAKGKFGGSKDNLADTDVNPTSLISSQTELRINVILKQFPDISGEELAQRIQKCDVSDFDESQLKELLAALPSDQEFEQIAKRKGVFEPSKSAEHFLLGLLEVDNLKLRLEVMLFVSEFPTIDRSVRHNCQDITNACKIIQSSDSFRNFLQILLKVGNKLNEGRAIGGAVAFDTNILPKLVDVPSSKPGVSLLHFLVEQLREAGPSTLRFLDELEPALEMARIPLGQMKAEVLTAREKYAQLLEEMQDVPDDVQKALQKLLQGIRTRLNSLTNVVVEALQRTQSLAMYLLEDPGVFQMHEYLDMLATFLHSVRGILEIQSRHNSVSQRSEESSSSSLHSAPLLKNSQMASVFQSLRNELKTTLVLHQQENEDA